MAKIETIKSYYESNMGKDLPDYSVLGWESEEAQHSRFEALVSNVNLEALKILDVGCGMGNFCEYLNKKGIQAEYTGVDILESMIECARMKNLEARFCCCNIFCDKPFNNETFDVVYASGIFNLNLGNNEEFLYNSLGCFFGLAKSIVAFNLLHFKSPDKEEDYFYFDPDELKKELEERFPEVLKDIQIIDDYLHNDFTVICHKK